jgi:antitoxin (DNA-binding transcriptional repressor) of toxin-antitoxin stability system
LFGWHVSRIMSDMKKLTMRDLNRKTASVLDALERGETFELHRNGKAIGYLTHTAPPPERKPDWKAHFEWLRRQPKPQSAALLAEFEEDRRRLRTREKALGNLP